MNCILADFEEREEVLAVLAGGFGEFEACGDAGDGDLGTGHNGTGRVFDEA